MRQQLRLRVILPVAVLGLLGAGFGAFAMGQPVEPALTALPTLSSAIDTGPTETGTTDTGAAETTPAPAQTPAPPAPPKPKPEQMTPIEAELADHRLVVVVFHTPGADLDATAVHEARAGSVASGAGFLAVDVAKEGAVAELAGDYDVLEAPSVLVLARGGAVRAHFQGYVDRETVAQAVTNASR
jgi:hypothetical protein